jgi:hypothetical protein
MVRRISCTTASAALSAPGTFQGIHFVQLLLDAGDHFLARGIQHVVFVDRVYFVVAGIVRFTVVQVESVQRLANIADVVGQHASGT